MWSQYYVYILYLFMTLLLGTPLAIQILATTATSETPPTNRPRLKKLRSLGVWLRNGSESLSNDSNSNCRESNDN